MSSPAGAARAAGSAGAAEVLRVEGVSRSYGPRRALRDVSFGVGAGELVGVIGPNGAGKTTLLSILAGAARADAGTSSRPAGEVGWVPQQSALYSRLTVRENLALFARLERVRDPAATVERMIEQTGLAERADEEVGRLSGGNRQRVNIAIGLLSDPPVLLLDEPSAALDPRQRARMWAWVEELAAAGTAVMFSTHDLAEAARHARRLLVLADGELLFDGTTEGLRAAAPEGARDFEAAFVGFLDAREH